MVHSHAYMFVPGWNNEMLAQARSSAPCTRSSAWSPFRQSEMAKARSLGIAASSGSRTDGSRVMVVDLPFDAVRETSQQRSMFDHAGFLRVQKCKARLAFVSPLRTCFGPS